MKPKTLREWIEEYEAKTGDTYLVPDGFALYYLAERGFAIMMPDIKSRIMVVWQVCGDGRFWRDFGELKGLECGLESIATICTRPIKPYIRAFGWEILKEYEKDGQYRFLCQDQRGRKIIITQKTEGEEPQYWVTHYFNEKAITSLKEGEENG